jgi:acyl-ACP thioesterase
MITLGTWAYDFSGFYGYRNFIMKDSEQEVLAVANSIWVYIDVETGKPIRIPKDYAITSGYGMEPPYPMFYAQRKVEFPDEYMIHPSITVIKSNIDSYNHVNNGQYIKIAEEYLPDHFMIQTMRVEYRKQAVLGDLLIPMISKTSDSYTVALSDTSQKPYAIIEFRGKYIE